MLKVKVRVFARLRELLKSREIEVELSDGATLVDLLGALVEIYGKELKDYLFSESGGLKEHFMIYINGVGVNEAGGVNKVLKEGDVVAILPPISGG
ncbi:MAG: MoaD family protein [Candidatus Freyarchaeota archaeon]|nr:MoaD family protein [Candidatus Jordarchaeia archaeon]